MVERQQHIVCRSKASCRPQLRPATAAMLRLRQNARGRILQQQLLCASRVEKAPATCVVGKRSAVRCRPDSLCDPSPMHSTDPHPARVGGPSRRANRWIVDRARGDDAHVADWNLTGDGKTPCSTCAVSISSWLWSREFRVVFLTATVV